jgi:hypothetical protein
MSPAAVQVVAPDARAVSAFQTSQALHELTGDRRRVVVCGDDGAVTTVDLIDTIDGSMQSRWPSSTRSPSGTHRRVDHRQPGATANTASAWSSDIRSLRRLGDRNAGRPLNLSFDFTGRTVVVTGAAQGMASPSAACSLGRRARRPVIATATRLAPFGRDD